MGNDQDEQCPCGSGKLYEECCQKQYDAANQVKEKLKHALNDPKKSTELQELLKQFKDKQ